MAVNFTYHCLQSKGWACKYCKLCEYCNDCQDLVAGFSGKFARTCLERLFCNSNVQMCISWSCLNPERYELWGAHLAQLWKDEQLYSDILSCIEAVLVVPEQSAWLKLPWVNLARCTENQTWRQHRLRVLLDVAEWKLRYQLLWLLQVWHNSLPPLVSASQKFYENDDT